MMELRPTALGQYYVYIFHYTPHLETLVVLKKLLCGTGGFVVLIADDAGIKHTRSGVQRVHGRVDTELSDLTRKHLLTDENKIIANVEAKVFLSSNVKNSLRKLPLGPVLTNQYINRNVIGDQSGSDFYFNFPEFLF